MVAHPGRDMPSASASEFMERAVPMVLQWPALGMVRTTRSTSSFHGRFFPPRPIAGFPENRARAGELSVDIAIEHRAAGKYDGRQVHRSRGHQAGGRGFIAAGSQHDAIERIAAQDFHQPEVGEITVQGGGGPLAGFLERMHGKFERDAAGVANAVLDARGELDMMTVAGRQIAAGLRDADDRAGGLQFVARDAVVGEPFDIDGGFAGLFAVVKPDLAAQALVGGHDLSNIIARICLGSCGPFRQLPG